jgi:hypothetical protein
MTVQMRSTGTGLPLLDVGIRDLGVFVSLTLLVALSSVPVGSSGSIQLTHLLALAFAVMVLATHRLMTRDIDWLLPWTLFVMYVAAVGVVWGALLGSWQPIVLAAPCVLGVVVLWATRETALEWPRRAPQAVLIGSLIGVFLLNLVVLRGVQAGPGGRAALVFTNPNQLAYFCVLAGSAGLLSARLLRAPRLVDWILLALLAAPMAVSQSKAGIAAFLVLGIITCMHRGRGRVFILLAFAALGAVLVVRYWDVITEVVPRLLTIGQERDDSLAGRGYDRIWRFPEYLFFGGGEGEYARFHGLYDVEIHSTIASVVFSYGIPGILLLAWAIARAVPGRLRWFVYLGPALVYGLTHNGIRSPLLWMLMGLCLAASFIDAVQEKESLGRRVVSP